MSFPTRLELYVSRVSFRVHPHPEPDDRRMRKRVRGARALAGGRRLSLAGASGGGVGRGRWLRAAACEPHGRGLREHDFGRADCTQPAPDPRFGGGGGGRERRRVAGPVPGAAGGAERPLPQPRRRGRRLPLRRGAAGGRGGPGRGVFDGGGPGGSGRGRGSGPFGDDDGRSERGVPQRRAGAVHALRGGAAGGCGVDDDGVGGRGPRRRPRPLRRKLQEKYGQGSLFPRGAALRARRHPGERRVQDSRRLPGALRGSPAG